MLTNTLAIFAILASINAAVVPQATELQSSLASSKSATSQVEQVTRVGQEASPIVCGTAGDGTAVFGEADRDAGITAAEVMEWIAVSTVGPAEAPIVSSLEIKYRNRPTITHGKIQPQRSQLTFDLSKREHITEVRIDCGGAQSDKKIQFISMVTSLKRGLAKGKVNVPEMVVYQVADKKVAAFRGWLDQFGGLQNLGLFWTWKDYGRW